MLRSARYPATRVSDRSTSEAIELGPRVEFGEHRRTFLDTVDDDRKRSMDRMLGTGASRNRTDGSSCVA